MHVLQQLQKFFLSWLTESHPIQWKHFYQILVSVSVTAQRIKRNDTLNVLQMMTLFFWQFPPRRQATRACAPCPCRCGRAYEKLHIIPKDAEKTVNRGVFDKKDSSEIWSDAFAPTSWSRLTCARCFRLWCILQSAFTYSKTLSRGIWRTRVQKQVSTYQFCHSGWPSCASQP